MRRDGLLLIAVAVAAVILFGTPLSLFTSEIIYVSTAGSDWNSGRSPDAAVATIQRAADLVAPGQAVVILPGVYREQVRLRRGGKPGLPVVFKALVPGTVTISGAATPDVVDRLEWRHEGDKIWSAAAPWPMYHVIGDGENFYHVRWADGNGDNVYYWKGTSGRVAILREISNRPGARGAFTYESGRLYLAFAKGDSPRMHSLVIHREVPRPYASWSLRAANVWVEAPHVRFEGLSFYLGVGSGLLLWNAQDVTVRDCAFTGAMYGIGSFPRTGPVKELIVERCFYHNYPQGLWMTKWLSWLEVYRHHSYSTLISASGVGVIARHNLVTHGGDGIELSTPASSTTGIEIYGNLLAFGTDDAVELDGFAENVSLHHNLVYDFFVGLGLSPVLAGPVVIRDNVFLSPPGRRAGAQFKLLNPWKSRETALGGAVRNVLATENFFSGKDSCFCDREKGRIVDVTITRNLFADVQGGDDWPAGVTYLENDRVNTAGKPVTPETYCHWRSSSTGTDADTTVHTVRASSWESLPGISWPGWPGPSWLVYKDSPATRDIPASLHDWMGGCN